MNTMTCHICGSHDLRDPLVNEVLDAGEKTVLVENIPARICSQCGEVIFSAETAEHIREMLASGFHPTRSITLPVFEYA